MKKMGRRKLGTNQVWMMKRIQENRDIKAWYPTCGWLWDSPSNTRKIALSLVKYGLLVEVPWSEEQPHRTKFILTADGEKWSERNEYHAT